MSTPASSSSPTSTISFTTYIHSLFHSSPSHLPSPDHSEQRRGLLSQHTHDDEEEVDEAADGETQHNQDNKQIRQHTQLTYPLDFFASSPPPSFMFYCLFVLFLILLFIYSFSTPVTPIYPSSPSYTSSSSSHSHSPSISPSTPSSPLIVSPPPPSSPLLGVTPTPTDTPTSTSHTEIIQSTTSTHDKQHTTTHTSNTYQALMLPTSISTIFPPIFNSSYALSSSSSRPCTFCSYSFPRPPPSTLTSSFFLTSSPNHGAGLGHQFGEWLMGPYLALRHNLTYIHTGFLINSARWTRFLGFGEGEYTVDDLTVKYGKIKVIMREVEDERVEESTVFIPRMIQEITSDSATAFSHVSHPLHFTPAQRLLSPSVPYPVLFHYLRIHVPTAQWACQPDFYRMIRKKYCLARIKRPVIEDLYADDRQNKRIVVAIHMRCGDSCYNAFRATNLQSVATTSKLIVLLLNQSYPTIPVSLHYFSQPPLNTSAELHFRPLLNAMHGYTVNTHFHTQSHVTLHHLIKAGHIHNHITR